MLNLSPPPVIEVKEEVVCLTNAFLEYVGFHAAYNYDGARRICPTAQIKYSALKGTLHQRRFALFIPEGSKNVIIMYIVMYM